MGDELEELRMAKAEYERRKQGGFFGKVKGSLERFRERQVEFGKQAREKAIAREQQKLELQKVRTERQLAEAKARGAMAKVRGAELRVSRAGGGLLGGSSLGLSAPRRTTRRVRRISPSRVKRAIPRRARRRARATREDMFGI